MASRLLIPYVQSLETPGVKEVTVSHSHLNVLVPKRAMWGVVAGGQARSPEVPLLSWACHPLRGQRELHAKTPHLTGFSFSPSFSLLAGEDPFEIQTYVVTCLDQLSLMAFPSCFFVEPTLEKETEG